MYKLIITVASLGALILSCSGKTQKQEAAPQSVAAAAPKIRFNADSAYSYIKRQVDFGPRVPGSEGHKKCAKYILSELARHGVDTLITQNAIVSAFNGDQLPITNIMGSINPAAKDRVLIAAHYDTRPWADAEDNEKDRNTPILGANDGGSGVGVILELARNLCANRPEIGVDFLLVDAEDYGDSEGWGNKDETWCLGTQYWAQHLPYTAENMPRFGIVLDMVGGTNARFHREYYSNKTAPQIVDKVWGAAAKAGYSEFFPNKTAGALVDDHIFIDRAGIPCIDIVESNNAITHTFPPTWHTLRDDMASIDTAPLRAAGQTVLNVIISEKKSE